MTIEKSQTFFQLTWNSHNKCKVNERVWDKSSFCKVFNNNKPITFLNDLNELFEYEIIKYEVWPRKTRIFYKI